jgi:hypothetical protein
LLRSILILPWMSKKTVADYPQSRSGNPLLFVCIPRAFRRPGEAAAQ